MNNTFRKINYGVKIFPTVTIICKVNNELGSKNNNLQPRCFNELCESGQHSLVNILWPVLLFLNIT